MIKRIVGWFVLLPLSAVLIVFALANRQLVVVNFNPLAEPQAMAQSGIGVPLFLVIFAVLLIGVLLGGIATWFAQAHHRRDERHWRRHAEVLSRDLEAARRGPGEARALPDLDELVGKQN
jgi:uncharacterized integral membrane protein